MERPDPGATGVHIGVSLAVRTLLHCPVRTMDGRALASDHEQDADGDGAPISVVLVEDHVAVAESLRAALEGIEGIEVLDTAPDLQTGLSVIAARHPRIIRESLTAAGSAA